MPGGFLETANYCPHGNLFSQLHDERQLLGHGVMLATLKEKKYVVKSNEWKRIKVLNKFLISF